MDVGSPIMEPTANGWFKSQVAARFVAVQVRDRIPRGH